jgi:hypothetical protein
MFISERIVNDDVRARQDRISGEIVGPADAASLTAFKAAFAPWDAGTAYLNFEEYAADSRSFFDELTYRRLAHVTAAADPRDMFRANHPIQ